MVKILTMVAFVLIFLPILLQGFIQDFFQKGGGGGGGDVHVVAAIVSMCVNMPYLGGSEGMPPPPPPLGNFLNLQPLKRFLVAPETTYTVWFVSARSKLIRTAIEGPKLESMNFEKILDILRSLTDVFRFKNPAL